MPRYSRLAGQEVSRRASRYPPGRPFEPSADSAGLLLSVAARETESRLRNLLDLRGIGLLTGDPGCGKAIAYRRLTETVDPGLYRVAYVPLFSESFMDVPQGIGWTLRLEAPRYRASARLGGQPARLRASASL